MKIKLNGKAVVIILSITFILIALFTSTYALFTNEEESPNVNSYNTGLLSIIATSKSKNISLDSVLPMTDANGILTEPYTFTITNVGNLDYQFNLKLLSIGDAETTISPLYIKVQIDDSETVYNLSEINSILKENVTLKAGESMDVKLRVWLSIDTTNDQIGKTFKSQIVADGKAVYTETNDDITLAAHINSLYTADDTATNNGVVYTLDTEDQLMKDVAGNVRYYGANTTYDTDGTTVTNEIKNYIYFNCETYPDTNCEKWRIIGVFDDKLKLIKNTYLEQYSWDYKPNTSSTVSNNWANATLNSLLNDTYYYSGTASYYNANTTPTTISFTSTGIKEKTRNLISDSDWYLGKTDAVEVYSNDIYYMERSGETSTGKIALPYASDYGYAADLNMCQNKTLNTYNDETQCIPYNWMATSFTTEEVWLLNPASSKSWITFAVSNRALNQYSASNKFYVYPTLYLDPKVVFVSGDGSEGNPYRIMLAQ
ncbi:MAG: hypothetical protein IJZ46_04435 [Bacilli bacterium]|nr:hypothetical protein [Bacilli bacterium]